MTGPAEEPPEAEAGTGGPDPPQATADRLLARMIASAEEKTAQAELDREEKRKPYEADPLFMYLWNRRYGTSAYEAAPLVRYLDRKVADLIGYDQARRNYAVLNDIPVRLREHADRLRRELDDRRRSDESRR